MKRWKRWFWKRPSLLPNVVLAVLVLVGVVVAYRTVAAPAAAPARTGTRYAVVGTGPVVATASAAGTIQSASTANADFVTAGTVTEIAVKVGDSVAKGQVLAKVDPSAIQDQLDTANANLTSANGALTRARAAVPADPAAVASAQAQVIQAQAAVAAQQRALDGTVLKAPIAGTVTAVNGSVGASSSGSTGSTGSGNAGSGNAGAAGAGNTGSGNAGAGNAAAAAGTGSGFIELADLTRLQVSGYFAEADATRLAGDQPATVVWSALANTRATGKVVSISPTATTQNNVNSYQVLVSLDSVPTGVRIGQSTTIAVTVGRVDDVLRVPSAAVRAVGGRYTVQVVDDTNRTRTVQVQVGLRGDSFDEITDGLVEGERVVLAQQAGTGTGGTFPGGGFPGGGGFGGPGGPGGGARNGAGRGGG